MKDYEVFKKWLGDVMDVIYGPSHNWPFKALVEDYKKTKEMMKKPKRKRARNKDGRYKGDDKSTPDVNEAWENE